MMAGLPLDVLFSTVQAHTGERLDIVKRVTP